MEKDIILYNGARKAPYALEKALTEQTIINMQNGHEGLCRCSGLISDLNGYSYFIGRYAGWEN